MHEMGSVQEIKWDSTNMKQSDHLIIQYGRDGGAGWFRIAQDIPAFTFGYSLCSALVQPQLLRLGPA